jgi:transposase
MDNTQDTKVQALQARRALHPRPQDVSDELFSDSEFFDARDMVQVKYEMLRRVRVDGQSVREAAAAFGLSRVTFYQVLQAFEHDGMSGLLPKRRGPKGAHKLTDTVVEFIGQQRVEDKTLRAPALARRVKDRFGISVHPRSIERALSRRQKGGR